MGGVVGVSTTIVLGWSENTTVSSRGLPRPIPVSGLIYDVLWFYDMKTYAYYVFKVYMYYKKKHWWFSFTLSFTEHVVLLTSYFPLFFKLSDALLSHAVVVISSKSFSIGDYCYRFHWTMLLMSCFNFKYSLCFLTLLISFGFVYLF